MTVSLDRQGRERVDNLKSQKDNGKKYIYESPDNGKTIYRREIQNYDDVSGVEIDWQEEATKAWGEYRDANDKVNSLEAKVVELTVAINKIKELTGRL
tara:strand:+ start:131 stop:424 length:294 start_codon:yes stop_codon:yes gene_type:complete